MRPGLASKMGLGWQKRMTRGLELRWKLWPRPWLDRALRLGQWLQQQFGLRLALLVYLGKWQQQSELGLALLAYSGTWLR